MRTKRRFLGFAAFAALLLIASGVMSGASGRAAAHGDEPHPAHIHAGSCEALGEVVFPLNDVTKADETGTPVAPEVEDDEGADEDAEMGETGDADQPAGMAATPSPDDEMGKPAGSSETTVAADLATILGAEHAINIHESAENIQNYIACGQITGAPEDGELVIELAELNDSGYHGEATLTDNGDGTTTVAIALYDRHDDDKDGAAADEVMVTIQDFAFSPDPLEITAGATVTWTNMDSTPHTVSQVGGGFESGRLEQGATFSFTFAEAGTFEYFCQFHPNMKGTIIVS